MKRTMLAILLALGLAAGATQAMTVREFLDTAAHIPRNPTALLRSDTRRLMGTLRGAMAEIRQEQAADRAAGHTPATCMPERVPLNTNEILHRFDAIPTARQGVSVTRAMREWMAEKYPCD